MKYLLLLLMLFSFSCVEKNPPKYNVGDCFWHINTSFKRGVFKVHGVYQNDNVNLYITQFMNIEFEYDAVMYQANSIEYIDGHHSSISHEQRCRKTLRKEYQEECLNDKKYDFVSGSMRCPTKKEYFILKKTWKALE